MIPYRRSKKVKNPQDSAHAYEYAIFLLSLRLRTEQEMRQKMSQRGYLTKVIDETVSRLLTEKLIDDDRYAEIYIDNLKQYKDYGYFMVKKKLLTKLLAQPLIDSKLEELLSVEDELLIAERLLKKENENKKSLGREAKAKLFRKFQSRGFRSEVVAKILF